MVTSKKLVAMFLVCIVMISSCVYVSMADGESNAEKFEEAYKSATTDYVACYNDCQKECSGGYTHCEMKCDEDCTAKLLKERIGKMKM
ncbi:hypothetical protein KY289_026209 [Solanum tuberosum]|nr:hypothetical protein KY289_026209 [Solanum tuberosum]